MVAMSGQRSGVSREERFDAALQRMREEVAEWLALLDDGFKPPELKVGLPRSVTAAAWELGLAWAVLTEERK
jgi:hypothetical protein